MKAYLFLSDGTKFEGDSIGAAKEAFAELAMVTLPSYQEELSSPYNYGKMLIFTAPFLGTYGINTDDMSDVSAKGAVFHEVCGTPSNYRCQGSLEQYLTGRGITGITNIDTRRLAAIIRERGVMNAVITGDPGFNNFDKIKNHKLNNAVKDVSIMRAYTAGGGDKKITVLDLGVTKALIRLLSQNASVTVVPYNTDSKEIIKNSDAVVISGGPSSPDELSGIFPALREICSSGLPVLATGLGHNALACAMGMKNKKLTHSRYGKYPIRNIKEDRIITAGCGYDYVVAGCDAKTAETVYSDIHTGDIAGLKYTGKPVFSVQFAPEYSEYDTHYIINDFIRQI